MVTLTLAVGPVLAAHAQDSQLKIELESGCTSENSGWVYLSLIDGVPPYSIRWSDGGNMLYKSDLSSGTYSVTVTDANNASATEQVSIDCLLEVGRNQKLFTQGDPNGDPNEDGPAVHDNAPLSNRFPISGSDSEEMSVYPIPAGTWLNVDLPSNDGTATIMLSDPTGREVISLRNAAGVKEVLNVSSIPAGSYLLSVQMNGKVMSNRVVVSK